MAAAEAVGDLAAAAEAAEDFELVVPGIKSELLKLINAFKDDPYSLEIFLPSDLPLKQAPLLWALPVGPPPGYQPWRLYGPTLFCHPDQFGKVNWEDKSVQVQERAKELGICPSHDARGSSCPHWSWKPDHAWKRELKGAKAYKQFNRDFLVTKHKALHKFVNEITAAFMDDFKEQFVDRKIKILEQDTVMNGEDLMLSYGDDADDHHP